MLIENSNEGNVPLHEVKCDEAMAVAEKQIHSELTHNFIIIIAVTNH